MSCEETREHLESCEDCRLYVVVEARRGPLSSVDQHIQAIQEAKEVIGI